MDDGEKLRMWAQILFWVSVAVPIGGAVVGAAAGIARYYVEKAERRFVATANEAKMAELRGQLEVHQTDLAGKNRQLAELEETAKQLRQGRTVVYYSHGQKNVFTGPLQVTRITNGPEVQVFNQMAILQAQHNFPALLALAEAQIAKTGPQWLTPYLFRGIALLNLGRREESIEVLRFVAHEAPDDEDFYKQAAEILRDHLGVEP
jgi:predicted Zn-dependent protease